MSAGILQDVERTGSPAPYQAVTLLDPLRDVLRLLRATSASASITEGQPPRRSLLELEGLGQDVWHGVDPERYLDELRDEWNAR